MKNFLLGLIALFATTSAVHSEGTHISQVFFTDPFITVTPGTKIKMHKFKYNNTYGHSWVMGSNYGNGYGEGSHTSWVEITFDKKEEIKKPITLWLTHLSADVQLDRLRNYAPVKIEINGKVVEEHYVADSGNWIYDQWDISNFVVDGQNTVRISLCEDAISTYWLNRFIVWYDDTAERAQMRENEWKNQ